MIAGLVAALVAVRGAQAQPAAVEAEREYRLGYQALQGGDCEVALVHYRRSLALAPRPRTRFNIAACQEELGLIAEAIESYRAFLDHAEARDAAIVARARARLEELRGRPLEPAPPALEEGAATPPVAPPAPPLEIRVEPPAPRLELDGRTSAAAPVGRSPPAPVSVDLRLPPRRSREILRWGLGGLGAAGLTAGAVVGVYALRDIGSPSPFDHDRGKHRALIADGLFIAGTAAVIVAWRLARRPSPPATAHRRTVGR